MKAKRLIWFSWNNFNAFCHQSWQQSKSAGILANTWIEVSLQNKIYKLTSPSTFITFTIQWIIWILSLYAAGCFVLDDCKGHSTCWIQNIPSSVLQKNILWGQMESQHTTLGTENPHSSINWHQQFFISLIRSKQTYLQGRGLKIWGH